MTTDSWSQPKSGATDYRVALSGRTPYDISIDAFQYASYTALLTPRVESDAISVDPDTLEGAPCIRGTRIPVYIILQKLEAGYTIERILKAYPHLKVEQVQAAIRYAANLMELRLDDMQIEISINKLTSLEKIEWPEYSAFLSTRA